MDYPKIRFVEAHPFKQEGRDVVLIRDADGIMENSLVVSRDLIFLLSLMDGTRSLRDIQAEYVRACGDIIHIDRLRQLVDTLDKNLLLLNDNFKDRLAKMKGEYEKEPVRKPFLAGKSYQADKTGLLVFLDEMLKTGDDSKPKGDIAGILAPHIDYGRGSEVYRKTYAYLKRTGEKPLLIIFGTCHHLTERIWSISLKDFSTPLDIVPNSKGLGQLIKADPILNKYIDEWPHRNEHSIELQLPLLQFVLQGDFEILPILTGSMHEYVNGDKAFETDQELTDIIENFKNVLRRYERPYTIICGADLAHIGAQFGDRYALDALTLSRSRTKDEDLLKHIANVDANGFLKAIQREGDKRRICGLTPIYFQLKLLEGSTCEIAGYGQWTDNESSVSFAGGVFYRN